MGWAWHDAGMKKTMFLALACAWAITNAGDDPAARVVYVQGLPRIQVDGANLPPFIVFPGGVENVWQRSWTEKCAAAGIRLYELVLPVPRYWKGEGRYDFSFLDENVRNLLSIAPDAYVMYQLRLDMEAWCTNHMQETIGYATGSADGKDQRLDRVLRPSIASAAFRAETAGVIDALAAYTASKAWGARVAGVRLCYGVYQEWGNFGFFESPDTGPAMTAEFRRWLRAKYGTDDALRKAWRDETATLATAAVPPRERRITPTHMLDPAADAWVVDYYRCHVEANIGLLRFLARTVKRAMPGRLAGAYFGYLLTTGPTEAANFSVDPVLAAPEIDFLSGPPPYNPGCRRSGGAFPTRSVATSYPAHGKLLLVEEDTRYHGMLEQEGVLRGRFARSLACADTREDRAVMRRNVLNAYFDRCGMQMRDPCPGWGRRPYSFDDAAVMAAFAEAMRIAEAAGPWAEDSGADAAVVVDEESRMLCDGAGRDCGPDASHRWEMLPISLSTTGVAYDIFTEAVFRRVSRPYRTVLHVADMPEAPRYSAGWLRAFAANGGCHRYVKPGCCFRRRGDKFMLNVGKPGTYAIDLPQDAAGRRVTELFTGRTYAAPHIELTTDGPETWLFRIEPGR